MSKQLTRKIVLSLLAVKGQGREWSHQHGLYTRLKSECGPNLREKEVMEFMWQLLAEGLVYVDYEQPAPSNWRWTLTQSGHTVVGRGADFEPHDPEEYLRALVNRVPNLDTRVKVYVEEALHAFVARCYLGSTVILGVAAERAFQLLGEAFAKWLSGEEAEQFKKTFESPRTSYAVKFTEFRKRIQPHKPDLPPEIADNMSLNLDVVMDLLRVNRNEAGHPTGKIVSEEEAFIHLSVFGMFLPRLEALREFFRSAVPRPNGGPGS